MANNEDIKTAEMLRALLVTLNHNTQKNSNRGISTLTRVLHKNIDSY